MRNWYKMQFFYYLSYDEKKDEFFGMVDDGSYDDKTEPIFTIDDTEEMVALIETGVMKHVDDVDGLFRFLVRQEILTDDDDLTIVEKALY